MLSCCTHDDGIRYDLHVTAIMPDHVHLILTPLVDIERREVVSLTEIMKAIKGASGHFVNRRLRQRGAIWQEESFDHVLRSSESLDQKIDYVLNNPVRRGIVTDWREYRWLWHRPFANPYAPPRAT